MTTTQDTPPARLLDCGHAPDPGHRWHDGNGPRDDGWQFVIRSGRKICHACDSARLLDCGHNPSPHGPHTTGTAHTHDGREICWTCADQEQREEMKTASRFTAYVSGDGKRLTTWSGGDLGRVYIGNRHPWSQERNYISATDCHGNRWHGTGAPGMWASLRRSK